MIKSTEEKLNVAGAELVMVKAGSGKPLLILHDELGYPGWMTWNETLAHERTLLIPLQPAYGKTPKIDWIRNFRDLGGFLLAGFARDEARSDRRDRLLGGRIYRGRNVAADQRIFSKAVLVAPMGIPGGGEIFDIFPITIRTHFRSTVKDPFKTPEFTKLYGGEMTPEQFEAFEDARAEAARIGWEPYMHNPSLPHLLHGTKTPTLLVVGCADKSCLAAASMPTKSDPGGAGRAINDVGHRPEIENSAEFESIVNKFLAA